MQFFQQKSCRLFVSGTLLALLQACAATPMGPSVQVMPGPGKPFAVFQADMNECKAFAASQVQGQAEAANQRAVGVAVLGTAVGAAGGALVGNAFGNAGGGAALGAGAGVAAGTGLGADASSNAQMGIQAQYDAAFAQCMYSKGHQVPGYAPQRAEPAQAQAPNALVRSTQAELIRLSFLRDVADGFMGAKTRAAIVAFQQANGLPADGNVSQRLLARLQATPTSGAAGGWVAPVGSAAPTTPAAPAPSGWVTPTSPTSPAAPAAPAGWVTPAKPN